MGRDRRNHTLEHAAVRHYVLGISIRIQARCAGLSVGHSHPGSIRPDDLRGVVGRSYGVMGAGGVS